MTAKKSGFTLLEILVVLAIFIILSLVGVPSYRFLMARQQMQTSMMQLYHVIALARSTAIFQNKMVMLCGSQDGYYCTENWDSGYIVLSGQKVVKWVKNQGDLKWQSFPVKKSFLQFTPEGLTNYQNGTFYYCPKGRDAHFAKALFITQSGRVRFSQDRDHDGIDEDSQGKPIHCQ